MKHMIYISCTLIALLLSGCHDETIWQRQQRSVVYVPHSSHVHPSQFEYTEYSNKPVQRVKTHYGPHRPTFFTTRTPNIQEMPEYLEVHQHLSPRSELIKTKRYFHTPGSKLSRPR